MGSLRPNKHKFGSARQEFGPWMCIISTGVFGLSRPVLLLQQCSITTPDIPSTYSCSTVGSNWSSCDRELVSDDILSDDILSEDCLSDNILSEDFLSDTAY